MQRGDGRSLIEIITTAMEEARQRGQDHGGQINHAVAAIMTAEPSISCPAARRLVETLSS